MKRFYVYIHRRLTDGSIFYVGKGSGERLNSFNNRNLYWKRIVNKYGFSSHKISENMSEACAMAYERALIASIGLKNLSNMTNGGDGTSGYKFDRNTVIKKAEKCMKPVINSDGVIFPSLKHAKEFLKRSGHPNATEAHISSCCKGERHTAFGLSWSMDTTKIPALINSSKKVNEKRKKRILASNGKIFDSVTDAAEWVRSALYIKCGTSDISRCCKSARKLCGGLGWKYMEE